MTRWSMPLRGWSLLSWVGLIAVAPWYLWKLAWTHKYREGFWQRWTCYSDEQRRAWQGRPTLWIHAVSVGELQAALPLIAALRTRYPSARIAVSTVTRTGQQLARDHQMIDSCLYLPLDLMPLCQRAMRLVNPGAVLVMETEIWPNFYRAIRQQNVPLFVLNARLSDASFRNYRLASWLFGRVLRLPTHILTQSERDHERFRQLGVSSRSVTPMGNLKFDQATQEADDTWRAQWRKRFQVLDDECLLVAGSTFAGEEVKMAECFRELRSEGLSLRVVIAPRHIERIPELLQQLEPPVILRSGIESRKESIPPDALILLDTIGELRSLYAAADLVFMGKSLTAKGGQNPIEPACWSKPILTGPFTQNFRDVYALFLADEAVRVVDSFDALKQQVALLSSDKALCEAMGKRAATVVARNQGALQRTMDFLAPVLDARLQEPAQ